jgi:hypothetical protein
MTPNPQAEQVVAVTDEMVERARAAYAKVKRFYTADFPEGSIRSVADLDRNDDNAWREALTAAIAAMKQAGWQPIETAPKDGSYVLLYDDRYLHSDTSYLIAQWDGDYWWGHRTKSGKCFIWREATHWQPLPAAPTEASR